MTVGPLCLVGVSLSRYRTSPMPKPGEALCLEHAWEKRKGKIGKSALKGHSRERRRGRGGGYGPHGGWMKGPCYRGRASGRGPRQTGLPDWGLLVVEEVGFGLGRSRQ